MEIIITIDEIDYADLVEKFYPLVKDKLQTSDGMSARILSSLAEVPPDRVRKMVDMLPKGVKDDFAIRLLNANKDRLLAKAERLLEEQEIDLTIRSVEVRKT